MTILGRTPAEWRLIIFWARSAGIIRPSVPLVGSSRWSASFEFEQAARMMTGFGFGDLLRLSSHWDQRNIKARQ